MTAEKGETSRIRPSSEFDNEMSVSGIRFRKSNAGAKSLPKTARGRKIAARQVSRKNSKKD